MTKISPDPKHSHLVVLVVVIVVVFVVVNDLVLLVAVAIDSVQRQPDAGDLKDLCFVVASSLFVQGTGFLT